LTPEELIPLVIAASTDKKAENPEVLDLRGLAAFCDYFVILSAGNRPQVEAIVDAVLERLRPLGVRPQHVEGMDAKEWGLIDLGSVIVHIFLAEKRSFYDLEGLWRDARRMPIELQTEPESSPAS